MRLLTVREAAERLGVDVSRIRVLIGAGRLPADKFGRDWLIKEKDLSAFAAVPRVAGRPKGKAK